MDELSRKDFKYCAFSREIASGEGKTLLAYVNVPDQKVLFHIKRDGSNVTQVCRTLDEAIKLYNKKP